MSYRSNIGCLWLLVIVFLLGGTPLLIGVLRVFAGFVLLALAGGVALSWWIRKNAIRQYTRARGVHQERFVRLLVALLVRLSEIDGELDRREVTAIRQFFQQTLGYHGEQLLWIRDLIKESRRHASSMERLCAELAANYGLQERFIVLQVLGRVASADGQITAAEQRFIETVAVHIGLDPYVRAFAGSFGTTGGASTERDSRATSGSRVDEALATLGLAKGASAPEIKQAWRKLSMENHPDRVTHLGEEFRRLAEERMRRINAAYETLKQSGMTE